MTVITLFFDATHKRRFAARLAELAGSLRRNRERPTTISVIHRAHRKNDFYTTGQAKKNQVKY